MSIHTSMHISIKIQYHNDLHYKNISKTCRIKIKNKKKDSNESLVYYFIKKKKQEKLLCKQPLYFISYA